jgi:hypothetical protein
MYCILHGAHRFFMAVTPSVTLAQHFFSGKRTSYGNERKIQTECGQNSRKAAYALAWLSRYGASGAFPKKGERSFLPGAPFCFVEPRRPGPPYSGQPRNKKAVPLDADA